MDDQEERSRGNQNSPERESGPISSLPIVICHQDTGGKNTPYMTVQVLLPSRLGVGYTAQTTLTNCVWCIILPSKVPTRYRPMLRLTTTSPPSQGTMHECMQSTTSAANKPDDLLWIYPGTSMTGEIFSNPIHHVPGGHVRTFQWNNGLFLGSMKEQMSG